MSLKWSNFGKFLLTFSFHFPFNPIFNSPVTHKASVQMLEIRLTDLWLPGLLFCLSQMQELHLLFPDHMAQLSTKKSLKGCAADLQFHMQIISEVKMESVRFAQFEGSKLSELRFHLRCGHFQFTFLPPPLVILLLPPHFASSLKCEGKHSLSFEADCLL